MESVIERLQGEHGIELLATAPTVAYQILDSSNKLSEIENPSKYPEPNHINRKEPMQSHNFSFENFIGSNSLCEEKRGAQKSLRYVGGQMGRIYEMPMNEIVLDFLTV